LIKAEELIKELKKIDIDFFCGVPDSLMSDFSKSLHFDFKNKNHLIASNEGSALGMSMGYHLKTNKVPLIYMQNSGFGNFINPYVSLLHKEIYNIPFVMLVGWRGEPSKPDEPQHLVQGKITEDLLNLLQIEYIHMDENSELNQIINKIDKGIKRKKQFAVLIKKNSFLKDSRNFENDHKLLKRFDALNNIIELFGTNSIYISTTGKLSRELYSLRKKEGILNDDMYVVGGMGHASSIALGILEYEHEKNIVCLDGDGSLLMHMGQLAMVAEKKYKNFYHVVFNNSSHESVGGQPNLYSKIKREILFKSFGYEKICIIDNLKEFENLNLNNIKGPAYIEIKVQNSSSENLPRPEDDVEKYKSFFMKKLND